MNSTSPETSIEIDNVVHQLKSIDEFGFSARVNLRPSVRGIGRLTLGSDKLKVNFRVREIKDGIAKCSFSNLSIAGSDVIKKFLRKRQRGFIEGGLESRSYDELASGLTGYSPEIKPQPQASTPKSLHATDASNDSEDLPAELLVPKSKTASSQWDSSKPVGMSAAGNSGLAMSTVNSDAVAHDTANSHQPDANT